MTRTHPLAVNTRDAAAERYRGNSHEDTSLFPDSFGGLWFQLLLIGVGGGSNHRPPADTPPVTVPVHNACALLDVDVLTAGGSSDRTAQAPGAPESTTHGAVLATYECGNSDSSVIVEIDLHNSPESARQAADYNTSDDQRFLIDSGTRVPFDTTRGGATIINTEPGVSRMN